MQRAEERNKKETALMDEDLLNLDAKEESQDS